MKRHVKASSAGSTLGRGNDLARFGGAFATRGGSCDAEGSGAPISRGRVALVVVALVALSVLSLAPSAMAAVQTRLMVGTLGTVGNSGCSPLAAATGTGDFSGASAKADMTSGSPTLTNVLTSSGAFAVGMPIEAENGAIPIGTTIIAVGVDTITLSANAGSNSTGVTVNAGVREITAVTASCGTFQVGQEIAAPGLPAGTRITAIGSGALSINRFPSAVATGATLEANDTFANPRALAFDQATKKLYALNSSIPTSIYGFDASTPGTFTPLSSPFPLTGFPAPVATVGNTQLAVDHTAGSTAGRLYYVNGGTAATSVVTAFSPSGATLGSPFPFNPPTPKQISGVAVDATGTVFASNGTTNTAARKILKYDPLTGAGGPSGTGPLAPIATTANATWRPFNIAFDSNGDLYVVFANASVYRFTAASGYSQASAAVVEPEGQAPRGVALDTSSHVLYVLHSSSVTAYDAPTGTQLYTFGARSGANYAGIAVDQSTDRIFLADNGTSKRILVYGALGPAPDATATLLPAEFGATSATLNATIDDNSEAPTNWRFQISKDGGFTWTNAGASGVTAGDGTGIAVSRTITGLTHNTDYQFRIITNKGNLPAEDVISSPLSFHTVTINNASVALQAPTNVTGTSADLKATVTENDPLPTIWRIEVSPDGFAWSPVASGTTSGKSAAIASTGANTGTLTVKAGGGTFALTFQSNTTTALNHNASAATVQAALQALPSIGAGNVTVSGGPGSASGSTPYNITFTGALSATPVTDITVSAAKLHNPSTEISGTASGLTPNSSYKFRVVVSKGPGSDGEIPTGGTLNFKTLAIVPAVGGVHALKITNTSARLTGAVDPRNSGDAGYSFQYGDTPALGSSTSPILVPNSMLPQVVSREITGLKPNTTYYLRIVATNTTGTTQSAIVTFVTASAPSPAAGERVYEMVSPLDKNGGSALSGYNGAVVAPHGDALSFCTSSVFGDPPGLQSALCADYVAYRGADSWQTKRTNPPYCRVDFDGNGGDTAFFGINKQTLDLSLNFDQAVIGQLENTSSSCALAPLDPAAPMPQKNIYLENLQGDSLNYQLLAPALEPSPKVGKGPIYVGSSDDFTHIVYSSGGLQTGDAAPGNIANVFEWDNGTLRLVSKDASGNAFTQVSSVPHSGLNGVSANGERIFFQNPITGQAADANQQIYMREDATTTHDVSESECTSSCGASAADRFRFASQDGSKVVFQSAAKLTDDDNSTGSFDPTSGDNADLFLYTHSANPAADPGNLTLLSKDEEPADGINADILGVLGISDDADVVYFAADKQIVAGKSMAAGPKLYRWAYNAGNPTVNYLGTLSAAQNPFSVGNYLDAAKNWEILSDALLTANRLVTPDGKYVVVQTKAPLDPLADTDSTFDIYRWDAAGGWVCASCQDPNLPSAGESVIYYAASMLGEEPPRSNELRVVMSDDGQRIFFETPDALVPEDVNGEGGCPDPIASPLVDAPICQDAYEWHDGDVSLLTTGTSTQPATTVLLGASTDGRDVFVYTTEKLVGWDLDPLGDIYDARIGGGLPEPPASGAPCEGESCRGLTSSPPPSPGVGSSVFEGPGNQVSKPETKKPRCPKAKRKVVKKGKTRCVKRNPRANANRRAAR